MQRWRAVELPSPRLTRAVADALVVAIVLGSFLLDDPWRRSWASAWEWGVAALLTAGALLLRRRSALGALVCVLALWLAVHTREAAGDPPFQFVALLIATYALGAHAPRRQAIAGLLLAAAGFSVLNLTRGEEPVAAVAGTVQFSVMFAFGILVGRATDRERALRERAVRLEAERDERARAAVEDERRRIARDLHDSLGHTVSAMVLQAAAVRRRLHGDQHAERESLLAVERSGRDSVTELRRMLGMLRERSAPGAEPLPSLARLDELAAAVRAAGVPVDVHVEGAPVDVPAGVDVAAYRILQEALTNVLKHAREARAKVCVVYERDAVTIEVSNDGRSADSNGDADPGHGLIGMRERVALYGGELHAAPREDGGFVVTARLPFGGSLG